jgi:hypothetical protein
MLARAIHHRIEQQLMRDIHGAMTQLLRGHRCKIAPCAVARDGKRTGPHAQIACVGRSPAHGVARIERGGRKTRLRCEPVINR